MKRNHIDVYRTNLPRRAILVYLYFEDRANKEKECWPSLNTIARDLRISKMTVIRAIKDLDNAHLIAKQKRKRKHGGNTSNLYKLREVK